MTVSVNTADNVLVTLTVSFSAESYGATSVTVVNNSDNPLWIPQIDFESGKLFPSGNMGLPYYSYKYYPPDVVVSPEEQASIPVEFSVNTAESYIKMTVYTNSFGGLSLDPNIEFVIPSQGLACFASYVVNQ